MLAEATEDVYLSHPAASFEATVLDDGRRRIVLERAEEPTYPMERPDRDCAGRLEGLPGGAVLRHAGDRSASLAAWSITGPALAATRAAGAWEVVLLREALRGVRLQPPVPGPSRLGGAHARAPDAADPAARRARSVSLAPCASSLPGWSAGE
ncbi:MAG: hypothetical protein KF878_29990 [Planctomycetes bacterium]|nr:hypothetical protein [Planctomycetota bacterium]